MLDSLQTRKRNRGSLRDTSRFESLPVRLHWNLVLGCERVSELIERLPEPVRAANPRVALGYASTLLFTGDRYNPGTAHAVEVWVQRAGLTAAEAAVSAATFRT